MQNTLDVLNGTKGARRDIVLLNAGAAIYVAGITNSYVEAIKMAEYSIDSGKANAVLENLIKFTSNKN